jgi:hypothetical protein
VKSTTRDKLTAISSAVLVFPVPGVPVMRMFGLVLSAAVALMVVVGDLEAAGGEARQTRGVRRVPVQRATPLGTHAHTSCKPQVSSLSTFL